MPRVLPGNVQAACGKSWRGAYALRLALLACLAIVLGNPVIAQGDDPVASVPTEAPVATEAPPPTPTELSPPPTAAPSPIEATSEPLQPTVPPTQGPADAPPTEPPGAPTQEIIATADDSPPPIQIEPTVITEPTLTPVAIDDTFTCPAADAAGIETDAPVDNACVDPGSTTVGTSADLPPCPPTVGVSGNPLDFGASSWNGSAYLPAPGTLTLAIDASGAGCTGLAGDWSVRVSALSMVRAGGTETIPPAFITYAGSSAGGVPPAGVIQAPGPVTLDGAGMIATTIGSNTSGGSWSVAFVLNPPADAPPGVYTGTIVIDVVASGSD